ncbi:hypothetical protein C8A03DRAFT_47298 [Achaetomium macrosporum]|uniref:FAD-binding domain-containing protein n=1 Tax=Achaetomium macrosporum TaxID=79813 RepID=A0AAN7C331_9PEZI|nr:hypothetical protein C8A03DRAFT_47298 [Achaetomium macrosporum]
MSTDTVPHLIGDQQTGPAHLTTDAAATGHVLIVRASLGGLCLAQGLTKYGISCSVFERDDTPDVRLQGYRIKIFADSVPDLQYLTTLELFAEFEAQTAETVMVKTSVNAIDSRLLARRVRGGPKPYTVHCGKDATHYEIDETNKASPVKVHFADGSSASGTLLVGADRGRSRIRRQHVLRLKIIHPEAVCLYGRPDLTPELERRIQPALLRAMVIVRDVPPVIQQITFDLDLSVNMFVKRLHLPPRGEPGHEGLPADYMYWSMLTPSKLLGFTEEAQRYLVELQDETFAASLRVVSITPDLSEWEASPFVTLIGDAIYVISPSGGVGAGTAIKDAVALTKALTGPDGMSLAGIKAYETTMWAVARASIERSFRGGKLLYGQPPLEKCRVLEDN